MFRKYIISVLTFLTLFCANMGFAQGANSILSTTLRQSAPDSLNVTFFTKSETSDAPIVKNKGNNQYVILLPNVGDSTGKTPDLRTVSNVVSDVNVKTINEGSITYTKVTITTKKPINVKAETRKTSQSVTELSGVNDIVAKVNLINQDIRASKAITPQQVATQSQPAPSMPKLNSVQDILNNKNLIGTQKIEQKVETRPEVKPAVVPSVKTDNISAHVPANTKTIKDDTKKLQNENIKNVKQEAVKNIDKMEKNIKTAEANNILVNEVEPEVQLDEITEPIPDVVAPAEMDEPSTTFSFSKIFSSPMLLVVLLLAGGLMLALFLFNKVKATLAASADMNNSFIERMNTSIPSTKKDFSSIAANENLNWQEKYASFKEGKSEEQKQELDSHLGVEQDDDLDIIEDYVEPEPEEVETVRLMKNTPNPFASEYRNVHNSGDVISQSLKRGIGLTAFEEDRSLNKTRRNTGIKGRFRSFETSPIENLNRDLSALLDTIVQIDEEKQANISSSIETPALTPSQTPVKREVLANATSPIQKAQAPIKKKMKIKESRAIDENRGFYLVDMEDKLALMGRIDDKFTVLKKFDDKEKKTLQVRRDKDNLYMVRTDGFKALVDVEDNKMGVLAEL